MFFFNSFRILKQGTRFYFNGTQMDFEDKYKDYTGTFLANANQVKQNNDENEEGAKNGQLPTNRQNGDM